MRNIIFLITLLFSSNILAQSNEEILNNSSIVNLYNKGLPSSIILSKIKNSKTNFDVSTDTLIKLKGLKIPDEIIAAMIDASGNKENATGDISDPKSVHESGIYYFIVSPDGKGKVTALEPNVCSQTKMGSGIGTSLTYGIAKTKTKAKIDGPKARFQISDTMPAFYFYFDKAQNLNTNSSAWFASSSSPNEFILVKMDVKLKGREFVTGSYNAYAGMSWGVDEKYKVPFEIEKIKSGIYKVTPKFPLVQGEYCFMYAGNTTFMGTAGKVFDFGVLDQ